jgi:hypothetical protein
MSIKWDINLCNIWLWFRLIPQVFCDIHLPIACFFKQLKQIVCDFQLSSIFIWYHISKNWAYSDVVWTRILEISVAFDLHRLCRQLHSRFQPWKQFHSERLLNLQFAEFSHCSFELVPDTAPNATISEYPHTVSSRTQQTLSQRRSIYSHVRKLTI